MTNKNPEEFIPLHQVSQVIEVGTLFIGGGPSTLGVFAHAYQTNRTREVSEEFAVIEASSQETFGGGNLVNYYGIRSNTSAAGFLKCISYPKSSKKDFSSSPSLQNKDYIGQSQQKLHNQIIFGGSGTLKKQTTKEGDYDDDNGSSSKIMPAFHMLASSEIVQFLRSTGKMITSLQIVGTFLNFVGHQILLDLHLKYQGRQIFYPRHRARRIDVVLNPSGSGVQYHTTIEKLDSQGNSTNVVMKFVSKHIVLATGGKQKQPGSIMLKKLDINTRKQKVYTSDDMLHERGFRNLVSEIKAMTPTVTQIVIIGGSHSAFSIAWLLLNGPVRPRQFDAPAHFTGKANQFYLPILPRGPQISQFSDNVMFGVNNFNVKIIYREKIKVYYSTLMNAHADDYFDGDNSGTQKTANSIVYPFTGIRGDAKELWRRARKGQEPKLQLVRADTPADQKAIIKNADIVIFATGYQSRHVPIYDQNGTRVQFKVLGGPTSATTSGGVQPITSTYEVDQNCRLIPLSSSTSTAVKNPLESIVGSGIFGIGLGYSLKTNDNLVQAELKPTAKADSVGLYVKQIGHKILPFLLASAGFTNNLRNSLNSSLRPKTSSVNNSKEILPSQISDDKASTFMVKLKPPVPIQMPQQVKKIMTTTMTDNQRLLHSQESKMGSRLFNAAAPMLMLMSGGSVVNSNGNSPPPKFVKASAQLSMGPGSSQAAKRKIPQQRSTIFETYIENHQLSKPLSKEPKSNNHMIIAESQIPQSLRKVSMHNTKNPHYLEEPPHTANIAARNNNDLNTNSRSSTTANQSRMNPMHTQKPKKTTTAFRTFGQPNLSKQQETLRGEHISLAGGQFAQSSYQQFNNFFQFRSPDQPKKNGKFSGSKLLSTLHQTLREDSAHQHNSSNNDSQHQHRTTANSSTFNMIFTSTLGSPQHKNRDANTPYQMVSATEYTPLRSKQSATKRWGGTDHIVVPGSMSSSSMGFSSFQNGGVIEGHSVKKQQWQQSKQGNSWSIHKSSSTNNNQPQMILQAYNNFRYE